MIDFNAISKLTNDIRGTVLKGSGRLVLAVFYFDLPVVVSDLFDSAYLNPNDKKDYYTLRLPIWCTRDQVVREKGDRLDLIPSLMSSKVNTIHIKSPIGGYVYVDSVHSGNRTDYARLEGSYQRLPLDPKKIVSVNIEGTDYVVNSLVKSEHTQLTWELIEKPNTRTRPVDYPVF